VSTYEEYGQALLPEWLLGLTGEWGRKWCTVFGGFEDVILSSTKDGVKARLVAEAPDDALPYIGDERVLARGRTETLTAYRTRLQRAWEIHKYGGTSSGVEASLFPIWPSLDEDFTNALAVNDGWHFDEFGSWSRYWILAQDSGLTQETWGGDGVWDYLGVWGLANTTPEDIQTLRRNAWWWNAKGVLPVLFTVVFSGEVWDPTELWPDGTWGGSTACHIALGSYWGLESHDFGDGVTGTEGNWGDYNGAPADVWGVKPAGII
jgi:hypothetical protein